MIEEFKEINQRLHVFIAKLYEEARNEVELDAEEDFGGNVNDAYDMGVDNGRAALAKTLLRDLGL